MFVQVIEGKVSDPAALERAMNQWLSELRPGAAGWLGSTVGVTDDGEAVLIARFESVEAAAANSARPEQDAWWAETRKAFDGEVTFRDSEDITTLFSGGSDDAGFVQVIQGRSPDRDALVALEERFESTLRDLHPGLLGAVRCWYGDGEYTEAVYFTSEDAAREGEAAMAASTDFAADMGDFQRLSGEPQYFDLRSPHLASA